MARRNLDARLSELKAKRRAKVITGAELRELNTLECRSRTLVEWVTEPTDANGDVIDPRSHGQQWEAALDVFRCFVDFPECTYVDVARLELTGSDADGVTDRVYDYRLRTYRDGRKFELSTTGDGLTPIEGAEVKE